MGLATKIELVAIACFRNGHDDIAKAYVLKHHLQYGVKHLVLHTHFSPPRTANSNAMVLRTHQWGEDDSNNRYQKYNQT